MQTHRQELLRSASRRVRRGRRATGRIVVSALGFGMAYYFDAENGELRRKHLFQTVQRTVRALSDTVAPDAGDAPPVFHPVLRAHRSEESTHRAREHAAAH
jgi:hypothetical protein